MTLACCFFVAIQIIIMLEEVKTANLVKGRGGKYCNGSDSLREFFDGDKVHLTPVSMPEKCHSRAYLTVDLGGEYDLHYVLLYGGRAPDNTDGRLKFFEVCMESLCFGHPDPVDSFQSANGVRVNVDFDGQLHSSFKLLSRLNEGLFISEIEAYTLASGKAGERAMIGRGCFRHFGSHMIVIEGDLLRDCHERCGGLKYLFFGIKENMLCNCGNDYNETDELPTKTCSMKCSDGRTYCGGIGSFSVFLVQIKLPTYIGCFKTTTNYSLPVTRENMTVAMCLGHCNLYRYAILQGGITCFCDNSDDRVGNGSYDSCVTLCPGNKKIRCGGKSYFSKYQTCHRHEQHFAPCSKIIRCSGEMDLYGSCHNSCKRGFQGEYCLEKKFIDAPVIITPPKEKALPGAVNSEQNSSLCNAISCNDDVNTKCVVHKGVAKCICTSDFERDKDDICKEREPTSNEVYIQISQHWLIESLVSLVIPVLCIMMGATMIWMMKKK